MAVLASAPGWAQDVSVTGRLVAEGGKNTSSASSSVVWLTPLGDAASVPVQPMHAVLTQKNKAFDPHLLVVTKGSSVEFPNKDPWFHNVFSLFNGKRFDLGLYEAGTSRTVHFDREGISYIFCNIHPEMSAVVVVLPTRVFRSAEQTRRLHHCGSACRPLHASCLERECAAGDTTGALARGAGRRCSRIPLVRSACL